jgi:glycosyltransferase involved in cell wall biosynthesis
MSSLVFAVPGPLDQATGGYRFDRQVVEGLRERGRSVQVAELPGRFPQPDATAHEAAATLLAGLPDGTRLVIDGLALPAFDDVLAAHAPRLRAVGFVHHPLADETGLAPEEAVRFADLEARLWPLLRGVICPSEATARAVQRGGVAPARIAVVAPGTARATTPPPARPPGPPRLLAVGTVTPRKGHAVLVQALAGLAALPWELHCIGSLQRDPATARALREAIDAAGLADRVHLHGERPEADVAAAYAEADVFVLPSYHEGYGMVFAEALAHRLPIVTTPAGALADTVPADASLRVPPGDAAALQAALQRVLTDADLRARLAGAAARAAATLPDAATSTRQWAEAFDRLTA